MISSNVKAALIMSLAMAVLTLNDSAVKLAAREMPLFQVIFLRGVLTTILLVLWMGIRGQLRLVIPPTDRAKLGWRSLGEAAAMVSFTLALVHMPLANVTAILSAVPLSVTLAAYLFLGEPLGWRRLMAITIGFFGVLLIIQPGGAAFNLYALAALACVVFVTGRDLVTRRLSTHVSSMAVALITSIAVTLVALILSLGQAWVMPDLRLAVLILGAGVSMIVAYLASIAAMRLGEVGAVAPFRYTGLVWALLMGYLAFGDWPNVVTFLGAGLVMGSGIFTIWREAARARGARLAAAAPVSVDLAPIPQDPPRG